MGVASDYKQTSVGLIPQDWVIKQLVGAVRIANGQIDPRVEPYRSMILVAPDHIESNSGRLIEKKTAAEQHAISGKYTFSQGDIVYGKIRPYLRKAFLADFEGLCSADMYPLTPMPGFAPGFILAAILGDHFSKYAASVSVRSGIPKINRTELSDFEMAFPPTLAEQEAIAEALGDADAHIEALEQFIAKKRAVKQGVMQELLSGRRRLPGFSGEWETKRLADLASIRSGGTPSTSQAQFWDGDIPWCTPTDITRLDGHRDLFFTSRQITSAGLKSSSAELIPANSVVMTSRATIGECAINRVEVSTNQGFKNFVPFDHTDVTFLYYLLLTQKQQFIKLCGGSTFLEIGKAQLTNFEVYLPKIKSEQSAIAEVLSDMDSEIRALEGRLTKARQIKQGMMQELLTGKTRLV